MKCVLFFVLLLHNIYFFKYQRGKIHVSVKLGLPPVCYRVYWICSFVRSLLSTILASGADKLLRRLRCQLQCSPAW